MTEGQVRYQTFAENQRHNMEMENIQRYVSTAQAEHARAQAANIRAALPYVDEKSKAEAKKARYEASAAYWDFPMKGVQTFKTGFESLKTGGSLFGDLISTAGKAVSLFA